jgi:SAM-dependent methyltransferase
MPDILYHPSESFTVVECSNCGLGFTNPRPDPLEIGRYYPDAFYEYFDEKWHMTRYGHEARYLPEPLLERMRLLDIGCANGDFPRFMKKRGWDVTGLEIGASAREIVDFPVFNCDLPSVPIDAPTYDAVTAWAVLEHVHDPHAYFQKVGQILRPGGRFVFAVTDFDSWPSRFLFREDLPRHLYFFTKATVKRYLEESGLEFVQMDHTRDIYDLRCVNWLRFCLYRYLLRKPMKWENLPERPTDYFRRVGSSSFVSKVRYVLSHPFTVIDRILLPIFEALAPHEIARGSVVFVAHKPVIKG